VERVVSRLRRFAPRRVRTRLADERRSRKIAALTARTLTPPPVRAFASFGHGSVIVPPARVTMPQAIHIGDGVVIHEHAWISVVAALEGVVPKLTIGDGTSIGAQCHIACVGQVDIGANVLTAARVFIGDTYHGYEDVSQPVIEQPMADPEKVTIGDGAFLGIGAVILPGVIVGEQAYVAAGAVVTSDVPARTLVAGNPGRVVKRYDDASGGWRSVSGA
jgi:acetyltransferase-like isoleucine patch superfamily enzyme